MRNEKKTSWFGRKLNLTFAVVVSFLAIVTLQFLVSDYLSTQALRTMVKNDLSDSVNAVATIISKFEGISQKNLEELLNEKIKLGQKGFFFIVDENGLLQIHPKAQGENWRNQHFISHILNTRSGYFRYISPKTNTWKVAAYKHIPERKFILVASNFENDFIQAPKERRFKWTLILVLVLGIPILIFIGRHTQLLLNALQEIAIFLTKAAKGNFSQISLVRKNRDLERIVEGISSLMDMLSKKARFADNISRGKLNQASPKVSEEDTLGMALSRMQIQLSKILGSTKSLSSALDIETSSISSAMHNLSEGSTSSASALEEISASIQELTQHVKENDENAQIANRLAGETLSAAAQGSEQVQKLIQAMDEINESSNRITKVIKNVDGIAFQTNLLALNASVEAARAGRHGKGFAVVADEVRNLAAKSAKEASETAQLIGDSKEKIESGTKICSETSIALNEVLSRVSQSVQAIESIARASKEQSESLTQINKALEQIDNVIQENAAHSEETASSSVELANRAKELKDLLANFELAEGNLED